MNERQKRMLMNLTIILGPVLVIMGALTMGAVDTTALGQWDLAISIGAMVTVLIFLFKNKK